MLKNDDLQISFEAKEEKPLKFIPYKIKNDGTKERLPGNINYLENIQAFMNDVSVIISNTLRENRKRKLNQIIREETRRQLNELSIPHVKVNIGPYTYGVGEEQMKYLADKHRGYITNENEAEFPSLQMASEFVRDVLKDDPKADFQIYRKRSL